MPRITTIPTTINRFTTQAIGQPSKRRVAGYARVSTDSDEQFIGNWVACVGGRRHINLSEAPAPRYCWKGA